MTPDKGTPTIEGVAVSERIVAILPKELVDKLTELASRKGLSRTAYIRMILTEHVQDQEAGDGDD